MKTISQYKEEIKMLLDNANVLDAQCVAQDRDLNATELSAQKDILDTVEDYQKIVATLERKERITDGLKPGAPQSQPGKVAKDPNSRKQDRFNSLGEHLAAVINSKVAGKTDPRLYNSTGLNESVGADGGFAVPTEFSSELLQDAFATGIIAPKCRRIPMSSNNMIIPGVDETSRASTRSGGCLAVWAPEGGTVTASRPKFRMVNLNLKKLMAFSYLTSELMEDSPAMESYVRTSFNDEINFQVDDSIYNGTGAGMPMGILNAGSLVSVAKESGQNADTIVAENVIKMYSRMFARSLPTAEWYINQNIMPQLLTMSVAVGTGGMPVYLPPGNTLSSAPGGALLGRPVNVIEQAETLGTQGDIVFADFQNGYILGEKNGIQTDASIHVQFLYDEMVLRFIVRIDGQPQRATPLTPYKGGSGSTQSHFIALDDR